MLTMRQGTNFIEGIQWLSKQHNRIPPMIQEAQSYIERHYSPAVIAQQWQTMLLNLTAVAV